MGAVMQADWERRGMNFRKEEKEGVSRAAKGRVRLTLF